MTALDVGYRVLLDKDGATDNWPAPTFTAHIPAKPTEEQYVALVEEFWWSTTYVKKARARGEEFFARFVIDQDMTYECLRRILEWRVEVDRDWSWKPGAYGRGLERELPRRSRQSSNRRTGSSSRRSSSSGASRTRSGTRSATPTRKRGGRRPLEQDEAVAMHRFDTGRDVARVHGRDAARKGDAVGADELDAVARAERRRPSR